MQKESGKSLWIGAWLLGAFVLWTVAVCAVDVQPVGPQGSAVGFATVNRWVHELTGVNMALYAVTDWLSLVPLGFAVGFGCLGLVQWIRRRRLWQVDRSILILGGFYAAVLVVYVFFEAVVINYRPVLIENILEASYPSSTTVLVLCILPTTMLQLCDRIRSAAVRRWVLAAIGMFAVFMVVGRLLSGVHWLTDIIGGGLVSAGLVWLYYGLAHREQ